MDVGYFAMPLHPPGANVTQTLDDDLEQIVLGVPGVISGKFTVRRNPS